MVSLRVLCMAGCPVPQHSLDWLPFTSSAGLRDLDMNQTDVEDIPARLEAPENLNVVECSNLDLASWQKCCTRAPVKKIN